MFIPVPYFTVLKQKQQGLHPLSNALHDQMGRVHNPALRWRHTVSSSIEILDVYFRSAKKNLASKYDRQLWIQWAWGREQPTTLLFWRLKEDYQFLTVKDTPLRNDSQEPKGNICRFRRRRACSWLAQYWPLMTDFSSRSRQRGACADYRIKHYMVQTFLTPLD